jgi:hypothetical protein
MIWQVCTITALNIAFFFRALGYSYSVDDWEVARCGCKKPEPIKAVTAPPANTEVEICKICGMLTRTQATRWWEHLLWNFGGLIKIKGTPRMTQYTNPKLAHAMVLCLHIVNCILIYFAFGHTNVSFLTALLFAVNPTAMQGSSVWLCGKGYGLALALSLLAWWLTPIAGAFYYFGSYFASSLTMPFLWLRTPYWWLVIMFPLGVWYRRKMLKEAIEFKYTMVMKTRNPFHWHNAKLVFKTIGYYFCQCVFPIKIGVHHTYLSMYGIDDNETKKCLTYDYYFFLGVFLTAVMTYLFFWNWSPAAFGLYWFFIFILPWSNWMAAVNQPVAERYAVISLVGALYCIANLIIGYPIVYIALLTWYACISNAFLPAYRHILDFALYNIHNFPDSFQGWMWKYEIERNFRLIERSFDSVMHAWLLRPHDFLVNNNVAIYYLMQHRYPEAEPFLKRMEDAWMPTPELYERKRVKIKSIRDQMAQEQARMQESLRQQVAQMASPPPVHNIVIPQGRNELCNCGSGRKSKHCCAK